jgi:hypothetical protein
MSFGKCDASSIQNARSRECEVAVPIWMETTDRKLMWHGMLLFPLGLITGQVKLRRCARAMAYWTALYGAYANWLTTMLAAIFGTAANTPIAAAAIMGHPRESYCRGFGATVLRQDYGIYMCHTFMYDTIMCYEEPF